MYVDVGLKRCFLAPDFCFGVLILWVLCLQVGLSVFASEVTCFLSIPSDYGSYSIRNISQYDVCRKWLCQIRYSICTSTTLIMRQSIY